MENLSIRSLIALIAADIDLFLLMEEDQENDKKKDSFTKAEIREQLHKTVQKFHILLLEYGVDVNTPLNCPTAFMNDPEKLKEKLMNIQKK